MHNQDTSESWPLKQNFHGPTSEATIWFHETIPIYRKCKDDPVN